MVLRRGLQDDTIKCLNTPWLEDRELLGGLAPFFLGALTVIRGYIIIYSVTTYFGI